MSGYTEMNFCWTANILILILPGPEYGCRYTHSLVPAIRLGAVGAYGKESGSVRMEMDIDRDRGVVTLQKRLKYA